MTLAQIKGQRAGDVDDKRSVDANVEGIRQDPGALVLFGGGKQFLLAAVHHLVGTSQVRILMLNDLVRHQVILQIGVRQIVREVIHDRLNVAPGLHPGGIGVLRIGLRGILGEQAKLRHVTTHLGQAVFPVHQDAGKPAEVVQAKVVHL